MRRLTEAAFFIIVARITEIEMALDGDQRGVLEAVVAAYEQADQREGLGSNVLCVQAVAGAGKSLLITEITRRLSTINYLFLCHTDNIADRARATLPANVEVATFAQAALHVVRQAYPHKVPQDAPLPVSLTNRDIYSVTNGGVRHNECEAVRHILNMFYASADRHIETHHASKAMRESKEPHEIKRLIGGARAVWGSQNQGSADTAPITSRCAIKLWTMGVAPLSVASGAECDICIVEEAQDLPDTIIHYLSRQRAIVTMFSDDMQALNLIAPFRKPTHPLQQRGQHHVINHSYRYGGELPNVLTAIRALEASPGEPEPLPVKGHGDTLIYTSTRSLRSTWLQGRVPFTYVASQAPALFDITLEQPDATFAWVNGLYDPEHYFDLLFNLACLASIGSQWQYPQQPRSYMTIGWLQRFDNLSSFYAYSQSRNSTLHIGLCRWIMARQQHDLLRHFMRLRAREEAYQTALLEKRKVTAPDITLSMVRAAKGHEWPVVVIADGLYRPREATDSMIILYEQCALRRLYTAVSRAQHAIALPPHLIDMLADGGTPLELSSHLPNPPDALVTHPYFGIERHRQLEMDAASRALRREKLSQWRRQKERPSASRESGQALTKHAVEASSQALAGRASTPAEFLALMRGRHQ